MADYKESQTKESGGPDPQTPKGPFRFRDEGQPMPASLSTDWRIREVPTLTPLEVPSRFQREPRPSEVSDPKINEQGLTSETPFGSCCVYHSATILHWWRSRDSNTGRAFAQQVYR